ncbi:MAG: DUF167 family protein [Chromatiales bacterium]
MPSDNHCAVWQGDDLFLNLRIQPKASKDEFCGPHGELAYKVRICAPPVDGKANQYLCKFIAKAFGVAPSRVNIVSGENSRTKRIRISNPQRFPIDIPDRQHG